MDPKKSFSRRQLFTLLGTALMIPALAKGKSKETSEAETEYQTLLKPDGTIVKVPKQVVQKSKVLNKDVSNSSMLKWLGKSK